MDKKELLTKLRELAERKKKNVLTLNDIHEEQKLGFFLYQHYDNLADALDDAGLKSSKLAERMRLSDEEKLRIIYELGKHIGKVPRNKDIQKEGYYKIFDKFGGPKKAYEKALIKFGSLETKDKLDKQLPDFEYKGLFNGAAGEYFVISELLYRGYIAQKMPVDLGLDVYAAKGEKTFFFQVKNISFDNTNIRHIPITISAFANNESANVFYIFIIQKGDKKDALIIDYPKMRRLKLDKYIKEENEKIMMISFQKDGNSIFIFKKDNKDIRENMTNYLDDWEGIV
jgi:hypothetical protein